jgi:hypothetical protein
MIKRLLPLGDLGGSGNLCGDCEMRLPVLADQPK